MRFGSGARRLGDLDAESRRLLDGPGPPEDAGKRAVDPKRLTADVRPGTMLAREWNGRMHRVAVLADGFAWNGKTYSSLLYRRLGDHRHALERSPVLWLARQAIERDTGMKKATANSVRCAIYTRVSTDQGLEQDFNSLDAQYDASQAYIRSQMHAGWTMVRSKYDDGGFSGGNNRDGVEGCLLLGVKRTSQTARDVC